MRVSIPNWEIILEDGGDESICGFIGTVTVEPHPEDVWSIAELEGDIYITDGAALTTFSWRATEGSLFDDLCREARYDGRLASYIDFEIRTSPE